MSVSPLRPTVAWARRGHAPAWLVALLLVIVAGLSPISYANADPYLSLLLSQALLEHRTVRLDAYRESAQPPLDSYGADGMILRQGESYFYYPPNGPSFLLVPPVAAARLLGLDMRVSADNFELQRVLSAGLVGLIFLALYGIAVCWLPRREALVMTAAGVAGSSLLSTVGTALWNVGFAALFVSLALLLLVRLERGRSDTLHPLLFGGLLFAAYASRPTSAAFIAPVLLYLAWRRRRAFFAVASVAALLLAGFVATSWLTYGRLLPPYYDVLGRTAVRAAQSTLGQALYGQTFSPSRGLFTFSPIFLLAIVGLRRPRRWLGKPLLWLCLVWFGLHLFFSARATRWWGGHSFGPRIMTDVVPALFVAGVLAWAAARPALDGHARRVWTALFVFAALWSAGVHAFQGLYNVHVQRWNFTEGFNIDGEQAYLFDWRYAQFLATAERNCARNHEVLQARLAAGKTSLAPRDVGAPILFDDGPQDVLFSGWDFAESNLRWTQCQVATITIRFGEVDQTRRYALAIHAGTLGVQRIAVLLNGQPVGEALGSGASVTLPDEAPETFEFIVDGRLLRAGALNEIALVLPDARWPWRESRSYIDQRRLALALHSLTIEARP